MDSNTKYKALNMNHVCFLQINWYKHVNITPEPICNFQMREKERDGEREREEEENWT